MANFIMPRITCQDTDTLSSDELTNTPRKPFHGVIQLNTLWSLPSFRYAIREWETDGSLQVDCYMLKASSKRCSLCKVRDSNVIGYSLIIPEPLLARHTYINWDLLQIPWGIRGHVFEPMALIEFVKKCWMDCDDQWRANAGPEAEWPETFIDEFAAAVKSHCGAFDDLVETHRKALEHMIRPNTHRSDKLHLQYAFRATGYLRLRMGEEGSVHWAIAIWSFCQGIKTSVEVYVKTKDAYLIYTHAYYIEEEFSLEPSEFSSNRVALPNPLR
ncbi:hypothetical protein N7537_005406 [Penicillium hordei]|uniref:Uncharacterized protein n=1 Tax=Penicillium hordei TaxID=40994 RepID=A0AAD6E637_9EURO|nr:uncharacterized protein N7537_005406 [Penicillium hordei]KAJ5602450.1 hypothetical protein N7537_005406 [Penicillium hordei]